MHLNGNTIHHKTPKITVVGHVLNESCYVINHHMCMLCPAQLLHISYIIFNKALIKSHFNVIAYVSDFDIGVNVSRINLK